MKSISQMTEFFEYDESQKVVRIKFTDSTQLIRDLADARHDYQTVLSSLSGTIEMLECGDVLDETFITCLKNSLLAATEIDYLVRNILRLSPLETGEI